MKNKSSLDLTDLGNVELVTLAVYLLGGAERALDTEDIAVRAHELGPGRFSWKKYPDQINLELVRVYLSAAKKAIHSKLISGTGKSGWRLTQNGLEFARKAETQLPSLDLKRKRTQSYSGSIGENRWRRERARITASKAWMAWLHGNHEISATEAREVYRIDGYAVGDLRETKITRLLALFHDDEEIKPFLEQLARLIKSEDKE